MTTLHVREDQLRAAVAQYPSVAGLTTDASFPHKLSIEVRERAPVVAIQSGGGKVAASGDGLVLRGMKASGLPTLRVRTRTRRRARDRSADARRARRRGRRAPRIARPDRAPVVGPARPDPRPSQRSGPRLRVRRGRRAQVDPRPSACSPTRPPRAPPTSTCGCPNGSPREASDRSKKSPSKPPPQTLKLQSRVALVSTRSRDLGGLQDVLPSYPRVDRNAEMAVTCENPNRAEQRGTLDSY